MGKTAGRLVVLGAVLAAAVAGASCALGPQPEPPGTTAASNVGGAGGASGSTGGAGGAMIGGSGGGIVATGGSGGYPAGAGGSYAGVDASVPAVTDSEGGREKDANADAEIDGGDGAADLEAGENGEIDGGDS
jgi:hypothetical protein